MKEPKTHIDSGRKCYTNSEPFPISVCGVWAPVLAKEGEQPTCKSCSRKHEKQPS